MTKEIEAIVEEFRAKLAAQGATFLLVYSAGVSNGAEATEYETKITSNSSQAGVRAILAAIWRPTNRAVALAAKALEDTARASVGVTLGALACAARDGAFTSAATQLFEQLRPFYTIHGWEDKPDSGQVS
jgi:hypothetical protein